MVKLGILVSTAIALISMAFLLIVDANSISGLNERIFKGQIARPGQFRHQVSICRFNGSVHSHFCGGAIIGDRFVLTTANCMHRMNPRNVTILVGTNTIQPQNQTTNGTASNQYSVLRITNHPRFNRKTMANDISLIRTAIRIVFTNLVRPVKLPKTNALYGTRGIVSGWGRTNVRK